MVGCAETTIDIVDHPMTYIIDVNGDMDVYYGGDATTSAAGLTNFAGGALGGVHHVELEVDGYSIGTALVDGTNNWYLSYDFNATGQDRLLEVSGYNADGTYISGTLFAGYIDVNP